jgi:serine/threonine protein kinase
MADLDDHPCIQSCENCGTLIDATGLAPLTLVTCPNCEHRTLANSQFHHFKLLEVLGSGGMGAVYRALDESLKRDVALKLLRTEHMSDRSIVEQFQREAAITASINHPHVVKVFSTGSDRGTVYIAMELVDKGSLDDLMTLQGRISEVQVLEVGAQIAQGLLAAHRRGLLHRDVKPGNILFTDGHTAKIVDFGLAALADQAGQIGGEVWGTPYYVAPEKLESPPQEDFRSDMYSLGSALFHAVAGRPPYEADDASIVVLKVLKSQPVSLQSFAPEVSGATAYVINRMIQKNPEERYQSYEELIEHLQYAQTEIARGVVPLPPPPPKKRSNWALVSTVLLLVLIGVLFFLSHRAPPKPTEDPAQTKGKPTPVTAEMTQRYDGARKLLAAGDPTSVTQAANTLRELDRDDLPQPFRTWLNLHTGLAQLLTGNRADAVASFRLVSERGLVFTDPAQEELGKFFLEIAALATSEQPVPVEVAAKFEPGRADAFGLVVCGVKNWAQGDFAAAMPFLTRFQSATPEGPDAWISEYQPLAGSMIADFTAYTAAAEGAAATIGAPAKKKDALTAIQAARAGLKTKSALGERLAALETQLSGEIEAYEAEMAQKMAALDAEDLAALKVLQPQLDEYCRHLKFAEALSVAKTVTLRGQKHGPTLDLTRRKLVWMEEFKRHFFDDLRAGRYSSTLLTATGGHLGEGIWHPTETGLKIMTSNGFVSAPWAAISAETITAAVESFFRAPLTTEEIADREWGLGLYLLALHREAEARPRLMKASAAKEEYRDTLNQLGLTTP